MIGEILRKARKSKHLTMADVAALAGVSTGYISNLEKNRLEPSLTLLRELSDKLGIPVSTFITEDATVPVTIVRKEERAKVTFGNLPGPCEVLTPLRWHGGGRDEIEVIELPAPSGSRFCPEDLSGDTDICVYVQSGEITYHYGGNTVTVQEDGSLFIPRGGGWQLENTGSGEADLIWLSRTVESVRMAAEDVVVGEPLPHAPGEGGQFQLVGERIRDLRKSQGFGVKTFAETVGVTSAYISQIERNLTEPSLRVLRAIARALNVELTLLFASDLPSDVLVTVSGERGEMSIADGKSRFQLMMPYQTRDGRSPDMSVVQVVIGAGEVDSEESIVHEYDEFCLVLEGGIEYRTPDGVYALETGDSLYLRKGVHHSIRNGHDKDARLLAVLGSVSGRRFRGSGTVNKV